MNDDKQKALIIVDASALLFLSAPIAKENLTYAGRFLRQPTYLDLLIAASETNEIASVEIPEVIVMESVGQLKGIQIDTNVTSHHHPKYMGFEERSTLIKNSSRKNDNGEITETRKHASIFVRPMAYGKFGRFLSTVPELTSTQPFGSVVNNLFFDYRKNNPQDLGEITIQKYIKDHAEHRGPIFFLTNDMKTTNLFVEAQVTKTRYGQPINFVDTFGFAQGMLSDEMKKKMSLKPGFTVEDMKRDVHTFRQSNPRDKNWMEERASRSTLKWRGKDFRVTNQILEQDDSVNPFSYLMRNFRENGKTTERPTLWTEAIEGVKTAIREF